jgi:trehalose synthase
MFVSEAPYSTAGLDDYRALIGNRAVERVRRRGALLAGLRVLHVNATLIGGGVSEMLFSLIPLMRDAGLSVDWYVLDGDDPFFQVTKSMHNALQGGRQRWLHRYLDVYRDGNARNASMLASRMGRYDVVIVHDPQPLALRSMFPAHQGTWFWRCHIDLTEPNRRWWTALAPFLRPYDQAIFSTPEYVPQGLQVRAETALPCIDPFRAKNRDLEPGTIERVQRRYGLDPDRPVMLQVSRFDPWKDPLGVLEAYRIVKRERPGLQLAYMASMASDDPEGRAVYERVREAAGDDPDVHLLALDVPADQVDENALEVNAMQRGADVVLQKSIREGFGLTVTEALWKEKPVVAGNVGGIRYQIEDGRNGYLVDDVPAAADRVLRILDDRDAAAELGRRGHETVRDRFLMTRLLEQYFDWFEAHARERHEVLHPVRGVRSA